MKKTTFFLGFFSGIILLTLVNMLGVQGYADSKSFTVTKASYPINVNGEPFDINAFNYEGNTYLKIIDINKYVKSLDIQWTGLDTGVNIIDRNEQSDQNSLEIVPKDKGLKSKYYIDKIGAAINDYKANITEYIVNPLKPVSYERNTAINMNKFTPYNKKIFINGKEMNIPSVINDGNIYLSINDLTSILRNVSMGYSFGNGDLHIYEQTGLGILENEGKFYIDFGKLAKRYSFNGFIDDAAKRLPYIYMGFNSTVRTFLDSNPMAGEFDLPSVNINNLTFDVIEYNDFVNNLPVILKIIVKNELFYRTNSFVNP